MIISFKTKSKCETIRRNCHMLLVGDPGLGKSQVIKVSLVLNSIRYLLLFLKIEWSYF